MNFKFAHKEPQWKWQKFYIYFIFKLTRAWSAGIWIKRCDKGLWKPIFQILDDKAVVSVSPWLFVIHCAVLHWLFWLHVFAPFSEYLHKSSWWKLITYFLLDILLKFMKPNYTGLLFLTKENKFVKLFSSMCYNNSLAWNIFIFNRSSFLFLLTLPLSLFYVFVLI